MPHDLLSSIYDAVVDLADDVSDAPDDMAAMAEAIVEQFDDGLTTFLSEAEALLASGAAGGDEVMETMVALAQAIVAAGMDVPLRLAGLFGGWLALSMDRDRSVASLLAMLFEAFRSAPDDLVRVVGALAVALPDFADLYRGLVALAASDMPGFRSFAEAVLLPLTAAALLTPSLGVDAVSKAIAVVLRDPLSTFQNRVSAFDLGLPAGGVPEVTSQLLNSSALRLRRAVWMMALLLDTLRAGSGAGGQLGAGVAVPNAGLNAIFSPLSIWFGGIFNAYLTSVTNLVTQLVARLLEEAENDFELEWALLQVARFTPVGLLFILVATTWKLVSNPAPFLNLILDPIENDPTLRVKRLEGPSSDRKYVILSDVHRDPESDARGEFQFGSIDHFMETHELYLEVVQSFASRGYVIIEAGDCEELWFHRDFAARPAERMREIVDTHQDLYRLLAQLHADGRYFRVRGNHDSYLTQPDVLAVLDQVMDPNGTAPFEVLDFLIIEGVKDMHDVPFYVGLDSDPNQSRRPLIITHGHQWDFWNCDANNILGKLIVSAVVTPLDLLDDPFKDIGGIASSGSALVNFQEQLSELLVFNSWLSYAPAVKLLDRIQHMDDHDRRFSDDIMYSETLASLMGMMIPVTPGPGDECGFPWFDGMCLGNLFSVGHTHNPHNEPWYDLKLIPGVGDLLEVASDALDVLTAGLLPIELGLLKSNFLNSGTSGWYERCVCGIDIGDESHGTGQPKLVFWTHSTRPDRPHWMDWELPHRPRDGVVPPGDLMSLPIPDVLRTLNATLALMERGVVGEEHFGDREKKVGMLPAVAANVPIGTAIEQLSKRWKPGVVDVDFSGKGYTLAQASQAVIGQLALALMRTGREGVETRLDVRIALPRDLNEVLGKLIEGPSVARALPGTDPLVSAIGTAAVVRELTSRGFRHVPAYLHPERHDATDACLGVLMILAQLPGGAAGSGRGPESRTPAVFADLSYLDGAIHARIELKPGLENPSSSKPTPAPPQGGSRGGGPLDGGHVDKKSASQETDKKADVPRTGVAPRKNRVLERTLDVRAVVPDGGVPLAGVWVELRPKGGGRGGAVLARAQTDASGRACLRWAQDPGVSLDSPLDGRRMQPQMEVLLRDTDGTEVRCIPWRDQPALTRQSLSLPVPYAMLRTLPAFPGPKGRSIDDKVDALCDEWAKRLDRDPMAIHDLCLTDLVLGTMEGVLDPMTDLERDAAKQAAIVGIDREALKEGLKSVAVGRKKLRDCLGDRYPKCPHPEDKDDLGTFLIENDPRLKSLGDFFGDPLPDPMDGVGEPVAGRGLPGRPFGEDKVCMTRYLNDDLSAEVAQDIAANLGRRTLAPPSVNFIQGIDRAWGNRVTRELKTHDKELVIKTLSIEADVANLDERAFDLDVELDDPTCLVLHADESGRQIAVMDVLPGYRVRLHGSGFVGGRAEVVGWFRAWEAEPSEGRLVPSDVEVQAPGLHPIEVVVDGSQSLPPDGATPEGYDPDNITFVWPEAAGDWGLYRIQLRFRNESQYPTDGYQDPTTCEFVESWDDVYSQPLYFAVLKPVEVPPLRVAGTEVDCDNLTDPESVAFIPWPDDLHFIGTGIVNRFGGFDGTSPTYTQDLPIVRQASRLLFSPDLWEPAPPVQAFPAEQGFGNLDRGDWLHGLFVLNEAEGGFDRVVVLALLTVAAIVVTLLLAVVVVALAAAVIALLIYLEVITAGLINLVIGAVSAALVFAFGAMFAAIMSTVAAIVASVSGADNIVTHSLMVDGDSLGHRLSPVRWDHLLFVGPGASLVDLTSFEEISASSDLGGEYEMTVTVETA